MDTLFDMLHNGAKDALKAMQKPIIRRGLKRKFRAGFDNCQTLMDAQNKIIRDELSLLEQADVNKCLQAKQVLRTLVEQQEDLITLYKELFNEDFNPEIE